MPGETEFGDKPAPSTPIGDLAFRKVLQLSPALQADVAEIQSKGFKILWGDSGKGTYLVENAKDPRVVIDGNAKGNGPRIAGALAHEIGHQKFREPLDHSSKESYVTGLLRDEAAATINNARIRREIVSSGGPDIGFAGHNAKQYREISDQMLDGKITESQALDRITEVYKTERTSNSKETYEDYYGKSYRGRSPAPEQDQDQSRFESRAPQFTPTDPDHPDHELLEKLQGLTRGLDQRADKSWDENSERMSASALVMAKQNGFTAQDDLQLSLNRATDKREAGELLFLSRTGPTASPDPAANLTYMPTAEALSKPARERYQEVEAIDLKQAETLQAAQQQEMIRGPDDPSRGGLVMR